jgi:hypothetical protein
VCHIGSSTGGGSGGGCSGDGGGGSIFHVLAHKFFWILSLNFSYNYFLETYC